MDAGWYWLYYVLGIGMGVSAGWYWGVYLSLRHKSKHPDKYTINSRLIDITAYQRTKIAVWAQMQYPKGKYGQNVLSDAFYMDFRKHLAALQKDYNPLAIYPPSLRPALFKLLYPDGDYEIAKWLRTNHKDVLKEYRVARKTKERLLEDG